MSEPFESANRVYWDDQADFNRAHWDVDGFLADPHRLSTIVTADRELVGDVRGRSLLHLQCHFGLDTLSWARLGAHATGIDLSPHAIAIATDLAARAGLDARFVETDLYAVPDVIEQRFEVVYTGGGALCWLPDIRRWGEVVGRMLRPGGTFYVREVHPMLWALEDERADPKLVVERPYFEEAEPTRWDAEPIWQKDARAVPTCYEWHHGLGEIVGALIDAGLTIELLREHRTCLWQALPFMVEGEGGWWRLPDRPERLPLMYSIRARKP
jgi:SAM-dependent methyltransferase